MRKMRAPRGGQSQGRAAWVVGVCAVALVATAVAGRPAAAAELGAPGDLTLDVHAFVSQGVIKSSANNYLAPSARGSFEFAEVGINFNSQVTERLRVGLQLFGRDLGPVNNYTARTDWFLLDYRWRDWLGFRAGRIKVPFGLYNDTSDIDAARVPVLLPQSVYPVGNRDFLLAQTGFEVYGYRRLGAAGALDYHLYGGTIFITTPPAPPGFTISRLEVPYVVGGRLMWETPLDGLRVGGSLQQLRLETDLTSTATGTKTTLTLPALLSVASAELAVRDLLLSVEGSIWKVKLQSTDTTLFPASSTNSVRTYAMASYRVTPWLQPGLYYSLLFPDWSHRDGRAAMQHDVAGTLRFDINRNWLVKVEGHYMHGTAGLDPALNGNAPLSTLNPDWVVVLLKTTAYF